MLLGQISPAAVLHIPLASWDGCGVCVCLAAMVFLFDRELVAAVTGCCTLGASAWAPTSPEALKSVVSFGSCCLNLSVSLLARSSVGPAQPQTLKNNGTFYHIRQSTKRPRRAPPPRPRRPRLYRATAS